MWKLLLLMGVLVFSCFPVRAQVMDPPGYEGSFSKLLLVSVQTNMSFSLQDYIGFVTNKAEVNSKWCFIGPVHGVIEKGGKYLVIIDGSCGDSPQEFICVVFMESVYFPNKSTVLVWGRFQSSFEYINDNQTINRVPFFVGDYWKVNELQSW